MFVDHEWVRFCVNGVISAFLGAGGVIGEKSGEEGKREGRMDGEWGECGGKERSRRDPKAPLSSFLLSLQYPSPSSLPLNSISSSLLFSSPLPDQSLLQPSRESNSVFF